MLVSSIYGTLCGNKRKRKRRRKLHRRRVRKDSMKFTAPDEGLLSLADEHSVLPDYYREAYKH